MITGPNPWLSMWGSPRNTVRALITHKPKYGTLFLASIYTLQNIFYFSNYWSVGFSVPFYAVLIGAVLLCPFIGWLWLYVKGWVLYFTGRWLEGKAPQLHIRTALAWSRLPSSINLLMWLVLLIAQPHTVFIQDVEGPALLFIQFIVLILALWTFFLLVQSIREVQGFSIGRALINVLLAWLIFSFLTFLFFTLLRFLYISYS